MVLISIITLSAFLYLAEAGGRRTGDGRYSSNGRFDVHVSKIIPEKRNEHICGLHHVNEPALYITGFKPVIGTPSLIKRVRVYACKTAPSSSSLSDCQSPCGDEDTIDNGLLMYSWSDGASGFHLPSDISFEIGSRTYWRVAVIQVVYKSGFSDDDPPDTTSVTLTYQTQRTRYIAGAFHLAAEAGLKETDRQLEYGLAWNCSVEAEVPVRIFATMFLTSQYGTINGAYTKASVDGGDTWTTLAERDNKEPETFYQLSKPTVIKNGDSLAARCLFNFTSLDDDEEANHAHYSGSKSVCDAFLLVYTEDGSVAADSCISSNTSLPLPETNLLGHKVYSGTKQVSSSDGSRSVDLSSPLGSTKKYTFEVDAKWKVSVDADQKTKFGQIGGMSIDEDGNLYIFHRGDRLIEDFSIYEKPGKRSKLIEQDTVVVISPNGTYLDSWGSDLFHMPYGIEISEETNSIWLTDIVLQQVFRFPFLEIAERSFGSTSNIRPDLVLGKKFLSGDEDEAFCQPAAVAALSDGSAVIADGLCNHRLVAVDSLGETLAIVLLVDEGKKASVVDSVIFDAVNSLVVALDRGNGRLFCISSDTWGILFVLQPTVMPLSLALFKPNNNHRQLHHDSLLVMPANNLRNDEQLDVATSFVVVDLAKRSVVDIATIPKVSDNITAVIIDSATESIYLGQTNYNSDPNDNYLIRLGISSKIVVEEPEIIGKMDIKVVDQYAPYSATVVFGSVMLVVFPLFLLVIVLLVTIKCVTSGGWRNFCRKRIIVRLRQFQKARKSKSHDIDDEEDDEEGDYDDGEEEDEDADSSPLLQSYS